MELLSLMAVMLEGLGFNLCVAPFLNVCVLNLLQRVRDGVCGHKIHPQQVTLVWSAWCSGWSHQRHGCSTRCRDWLKALLYQNGYSSTVWHKRTKGWWQKGRYGQGRKGWKAKGPLHAWVGCIGAIMRWFIGWLLHGDYQRLTTELLSLMAVMSEGLGFNLCVAPFLNICVLNLSWRVGSRRCWR